MDTQSHSRTWTENQRRSAICVGVSWLAIATLLAGCEAGTRAPTEQEMRAAVAILHEPEARLVDFRELEAPVAGEGNHDLSFEATLAPEASRLRLAERTFAVRSGITVPIVGSVRLQPTGKNWTSSEATAELAVDVTIADDARAQRHTLDEINTIGRAMKAWITDNLQSHGGGDAERIDLSIIEQISAEELEALVVPRYLPLLPRRDGWGHEYEYFVHRPDLLRDSGLLAIRSPGRDGKFSRSWYRDEYFGMTAYDEDIVWLDGRLLRRPQR